jgi:putative phosphoesterase
LIHIGLISDTHVPNHRRQLPEQLKEPFRNVDLILHAGDIYVPWVLDELEYFAPVLAACGDDDPPPTLNDIRVKEKHRINLNGSTLWLIHKRPLWWPLMSEETPDVIIFGHTHSSTVERKKNVILVNPGSPNHPSYEPKPGTVAILTLDSDIPKVDIIQL